MSDINPKEVNIGAEALSGGIARVFLLGLGFVGSIVFARVLGATGFGVFYLLVTIENVVDRPITGVADAVKKRLSEEGADPNQLFGAFFALFIPFVTLVVLAAILGQDWLNGYVQRDDAYLLFIALFVPLALQDTSNTLLSSTGRVGLTNWIDALRSAITIPAQLGLLVIGYGVFGMVAGLGGASVITAFLVLYILHVRPELPTRETFESIFEYARYSIPSSLTSFGYDRLALLFMGAYFGPTVAGYFEATLKLTVPALVLGMMASNALMPKISSLSSKGESITRELRDVMTYSSIIAIPLAFGALALSHKIVITVYGSEFAPAAKFFVGIAAFRFINTRTQPLVGTLRGLDRPDYDLYGSIGSIVALVVVAVPAVWLAGPSGIIISLLAAAGTRYILATVFLRKEIGSLPHITRPVISQFASAIIMYGIVDALYQTLPIQPTYRLFLVVGFGGIIYFSILLIISSETRQTARYILRDFIDDKLAGVAWLPT